MPDIEVMMSNIKMTRRCVVMSPWLEHGDISKTMTDALEMKWTGGGVVVNRRLESLQISDG
jgi:hypothetical protein